MIDFIFIQDNKDYKISITYPTDYNKTSIQDSQIEILKESLHKKETDDSANYADLDKKNVEHFIDMNKRSVNSQD